MKAEVEMQKSFDDGKWFTKTYEAGDFQEFFKKEGAYLDKLSGILEEKGKAGEEFTVTYTVKVVK